MTILSNGNVGINEIDPQYQLDVGGDINLTGDIRSNGTIWEPTPLIISETTNDLLYVGGKHHD